MNGNAIFLKIGILHNKNIHRDLYQNLKWRETIRKMEGYMIMLSENPER
jgi:hypothetical protein